MKIKKIETDYSNNKILQISNEIYMQYNSFFNEEFNIINIYPNIEKQSFIGFGAAFNESTAYNFSKLPKDKKSQLLYDYFSEEGLNYHLCRTTINSCDFSLKNYTYINMFSKDLNSFSIEHDKKYLIPMIKSALAIHPNLNLIATPWSPPAFMKDNKNMNHGGKLLPKYKQMWANYICKYIEEYKKENININFLTVQNEPSATQNWESCIFSPEEMSEFLNTNLIPTFKHNNIDTKILLWDHNKDNILNGVLTLFNNLFSDDLIAGIGYHWYTGDHFDNLALLKNIYPDKLLINTERCTGYSNFKKSDEIINAELYSHDIIGNLNSGSSGEVDWNMLLDYNGGPNHKKNNCDSHIMLTKDNSDYIKHLSYYYIAHFSKYILPGAKRIEHSSYTKNIDIISFKNIDNSIAIVILNTNNFSVNYTLSIESLYIKDTINPHSIISYVLKK